MINSICVCGAGTMGSGIAQTAAAAGFYTILYELNQPVLEKAKEVRIVTVANEKVLDTKHSGEELAKNLSRQVG